MIDRFKKTMYLAVQQAYWLVSQTIGLILSNVISPLLFMSGSILFGPGIVARDYLLQREFTDEQRATMGSVASFAGSIVYAIVAFWIGIVADHFGLAAGVRLRRGYERNLPATICVALHATRCGRRRFISGLSQERPEISPVTLPFTQCPVNLCPSIRLACRPRGHSGPQQQRPTPCPNCVQAALI